MWCVAPTCRSIRARALSFFVAPPCERRCSRRCWSTRACWYTHESPAHLKLRVASHLRKCRVPAHALPDRTLVLPVSQPPLTLGFLPTMVLAPEGAGKSTLLATAAREAAVPADAARAPAPAVLVRIRHTPTSAGTSAATSSELSVFAQLDATAQLVYSQIGFPVRRALLKLALDGVEITMKGGMSYKLKADTVTSRLSTALSTLFEVSAALCHERVAAGLSREDAAPVLLFDEVQDLIRDDRLANAGGLAVFLALSKLLVTYGLDQRVVRSAVTGSSALLSVAFECTVARGGRWSFYELRDPEEATVLDALHARGYSPRDAADMVALCGTRLRLLEGPLTAGAAMLGARQFMAAAQTSAMAHFADVLSAGSVADAAVCTAALDAVQCFEEGARCDAPMLGRVFTAQHAAAASAVLYVRRDRTLAFQSRLHSQMWRRERARLTKAPRGRV